MFLVQKNLACYANLMIISLHPTLIFYKIHNYESNIYIYHMNAEQLNAC